MPVAGLLTAFVLLDERPSLMVFAGAAIILSGLALVVGIIDKLSGVDSENNREAVRGRLS